MEDLGDLINSLIKDTDSLDVKKSKRVDYVQYEETSARQVGTTHAHIRYSTEYSVKCGKVKVVVEREVLRSGRFSAPDDVWDSHKGWFFHPVSGCLVFYRMRLFSGKSKRPYETHEIILDHTEELGVPHFKQLFRLYYQLERQHMTQTVEASFSPHIDLT